MHVATKVKNVSNLKKGTYSSEVQKIMYKPTKNILHILMTAIKLYCNCTVTDFIVKLSRKAESSGLV